VQNQNAWERERESCHNTGVQKEMFKKSLNIAKIPNLLEVKF
jgi:hypothetical protein